MYQLSQTSDKFVSLKVQNIPSRNICETLNELVSSWSLACRLSTKIYLITECIIILFLINFASSLISHKTSSTREGLQTYRELTPSPCSGCWVGKGSIPVREPSYVDVSVCQRRLCFNCNGCCKDGNLA